MKTMQRMLATGLLAAGALGAVGVAQARDVYWSVGVGSPGVSVGVGNVPPAYYGPAPVYYGPPGHWHKKPRKHRRHRGWDD